MPRRWRVGATARHFCGAGDVAARHLVAHGCEFIETGWGHEEADSALTADEIVRILSDLDAVIVGGCHMSRSVISQLPRLKVLARRGVGFESVDITAASEHGVMVTITPGANSGAVADHAMGVLLAVCRNILAGHRCIVDGRWQAFMGTELSGKTFGIVGLGRIGKRLALRARGFEMDVLATDPVRDDEFARQHCISYVGLDELLAQSDFLSLNAPLTNDTYHLIDAKALAAMKRSAVLINTARGQLVDYVALEAALRAGGLAGAGLDVFDREPVGNTSLADVPSVVLSPHTAGYSHEGIALSNLMAASCVTELMAGRLPQRDAVVNPGAWERSCASCADNEGSLT